VPRMKQEKWNLLQMVLRCPAPSTGALGMPTQVKKRAFLAIYI
jgi:hypothetical protein